MQEEMKAWWHHHDATIPKFETDDKIRVEDLTGRIPLLLRPLFKYGGKTFCDVEAAIWEEPEITAVRNNISNFANEFKTERGSISDLSVWRCLACRPC
jgi:hypothetical protein